MLTVTTPPLPSPTCMAAAPVSSMVRAKPLAVSGSQLAIRPWAPLSGVVGKTQAWTVMLSTAAMAGLAGTVT